MDSGIGSSIPELKDFQIGSWVPATPAKPGLLTLEPICKTVQENQQIRANWSDLQTIPQDFCLGQINQLEPGGFLQGNDALTRDDRCDLTNLVTDGGVNSWEAAVASKSSMQEGALNLENFSIDHADNWNNVSFGNLLALAHAAGTTAPVENAPAHTAFDPLFSSQNADGSSVSSRISFNLNSPPGRDAASSSNSFQFAPITPVQNKGRQSKVNLNLNLNEIPILEEDVQENVEESDLQGNKEQSVPVRELSEMMENHRPDKTVAEANKTPQTKPRRKKPRPKVVVEVQTTPQQKPRRKKPRPKVVVEGQAKRANKPELTEVNISYDLRNHEIGSISQQAHNVNATSQFEVLHGAQTNAALQSPKYLQPLNTDVLKRKRSKGFTRACDLVSLHEICKQFPTYSSREAAAKQHTGHLNTCMEALAADARPTMKMKKRSKRNSLNGSLPALKGWCPYFYPIDEITEQLTYLNINADGPSEYFQREILRYRLSNST